MAYSSFIKWVRTPNDSTGQGVLALLDDAEAALRRMIGGIFWFFWEGIPDWLIPLWRKLTTAAERLVRLLVRISARLMRVLVLLAIWFAILVAPIYILSALPLLATTWGFLACLGSGYGLYRWSKTSPKAQSETTCFDRAPALPRTPSI